MIENKQLFVIEGSILKRYTGPGGDVTVPEGLTEIDYVPNLSDDDFFDGLPGETFKRCYHLKDVFLPASATDIDPEAFSDCGKGKYVTHTLTIHAPAGSYAEKYADDCGHRSVPTPQGHGSASRGFKSVLLERSQSVRDFLQDCYGPLALDDDVFGENETD